jgi:hypothetical protein
MALVQLGNGDGATKGEPIVVLTQRVPEVLVGVGRVYGEGKTGVQRLVGQIIVDAAMKLVVPDFIV